MFIFFQNLSLPEWLFIFAVVTTVTTFFEKTLGIDIIGRRIFRFIWFVIKFIFRRLLMPFRPEIDALKKRLIQSKELEKQILEFINAEKSKNERFDGFEQTLAVIKKEVTFNGGSSMKDAVARLLVHDSEKWAMLQNLDYQSRIITLRLDIADESCGRMSFYLDADKNCISISANYLRHFGFTEKDILGSSWESLIHKKDRTAVRKLWRESYAKKIAYRNEQIITGSDGEEFKCLVCGYPQFDSEKKFIGFYGTVEILDEIL